MMVLMAIQNGFLIYRLNDILLKLIVLNQFNIRMSEAHQQNQGSKTKKIKKKPSPQADHRAQSHKNNNKPANTDARFAKASYDPKFLTPSSNITKVKIDKRFSKMMNDPSFKTNSTIDRYGRKINPNEANDELKQYYYMEDEKSEEDQVEQHQEHIDEQNQEEPHEGIRDWMQNYDEQSSQLSDIPDELNQEDIDNVWNDESEHVIKGENVAITKRLALCNYDWMNISSKDLMLLFSSFKTNTGYIKSVKVYMSNIGKQKLEQEEKYGPRGIWKNQEQEHVTQNKTKEWRKSWKELLEDREEDVNAFDEKKLREYQKQRLKYFYAVIQCDSKRTADQIYKECDGNQFQNSNLPFDLRFIPDQIQFDSSQLKEECNDLPVGGEVKNFITKALGHSKVSLSWEDPELSLAASLKKKNWNKLTDKQLDNMDWSMYINEEDAQKEDGVKKIINQNKKEADISDWRKTSNKKFRKADDDIEITFQGGFDTKNKKNAKLEEQVPSLKKQKKTMKERRRQHEQQKRKRRQQLQLLVDDNTKADFKVNLNDDRFKAVYENPMYTIDPVDPRFDHRRSGKVFEEIVKRNKNKNKE